MCPGKCKKSHHYVIKILHVCVCILQGQFIGNTTTLPAASCPYVAPDECSSGGSDPLPCCERVVTRAPPPTQPTAGAAHLVTNIGVVFILLLVMLMTF